MPTENGAPKKSRCTKVLVGSKDAPEAPIRPVIGSANRNPAMATTTPQASAEYRANEVTLRIRVSLPSPSRRDARVDEPRPNTPAIAMMIPKTGTPYPVAASSSTVP